MIPVGWLFALERIAPGALLLLCVAWLAAMYITRRLAIRAAQRLADSHQLTGEDRQNFLEWNEHQQKLRATVMVFPVAVVTWVVLVGLSFAAGVLPYPTASAPARTAPAAHTGPATTGTESLATLHDRATRDDPAGWYRR